MNVRPTSIDDYLEWTKSTLSMDFGEEAYVNLYGANLNNAFNTISESEFYKNLESQLSVWEEEYRESKSSELLMEHGELILFKKPYQSAVDKSFRINVLWNRNFPDEPKRGWITPENLFTQLHDVIRGTLVCKFLDGPEFLTNHLIGYANGLGLEARSYSQERDEGYYALHFYITFGVELLNKELQAQDSRVELEIQTTTQLQEILKGLTYPYYKESRTQPTRDRSKWKWEYETNRFKAGYLGHTLHLMEAMIVQLRDANTGALTTPATSIAVEVEPAAAVDEASVPVEAPTVDTEKDSSGKTQARDVTHDVDNEKVKELIDDH